MGTEGAAPGGMWALHKTAKMSFCSKPFQLQLEEKKTLWKPPQFLSRTDFFWFV